MRKMFFNSWMDKLGIFVVVISIFLIIVLITFMVINKFRDDDLLFKSLPPNVIIIVMDTVRQDHLSCYGYKRDTSPNLDQLKRGSRIYYNAYSTSCWTSSAHASLFTGLYPIVHKTTQENWRMSDRLKTLAEIFSTSGYETVGIVENPMLSKYFNFDQGFSMYHETWIRSYKDRIIKWFTNENSAFILFKRTLKKRDKRKPFFMFINFIEPHSPYNSSQQFYGKFLSDRSLQCEENMVRRYFLGKIFFNQHELQHLNELYDAEILYVDYWIGKMIDELKKRDLWNNTIFIVTSDHGENIGDHGMMDHIFCLYESTIKIPLIIHYPQLFPCNSEDYNIVQLTDIFPTLLKIVGIDTKKYYYQGCDLLERNLKEEKIGFYEYYYPKQVIEYFREPDRENARLKKYKRRLRAVIMNNLKLIWGSDGNHELYDLAKDPDEKDNLIDKKKYLKEKQELINMLRNMVSKYDQNTNDYSNSMENKAIDKNTMEALRSLGYVR